MLRFIGESQAHREVVPISSSHIQRRGEMSRVTRGAAAMQRLPSDAVVRYYRRRG
jgi:hypothetical protein